MKIFLLNFSNRIFHQDLFYNILTRILWARDGTGCSVVMDDFCSFSHRGGFKLIVKDDGFSYLVTYSFTTTTTGVLSE